MLNKSLKRDFTKIKENTEGQASTTTKAFPRVVTRGCHQTQKLSTAENNFLFLIRLKKQFLEE
jgi:hypothetical protein